MSITVELSRGGDVALDALPEECIERLEREIESRVTIPDFTRGKERGQ